MDALQREEDQLRQKISSKMTVSTFLAGSNFTVLILILTLLGNKKDLTANSLTMLTCKIEPQSLLEISAVLFFLSTTLFVSSIYSYDQLLMPRSFWSIKYDHSRLRHMMSSFVQAFGAPAGNRVYVYMLSVWYTMFIPATFFSATAIILLFYTIVQFKAFVSTLGIILFVLVYYWFMKPRLGID